ncbi:hypothetical protein GCM10011515_21650 [Tsuneonella deserti]|uniref:Uncharacterized protein n=1 Tax=Tsuneonella deserti TaxID=2035528 RepID=A0ABQ1SCU2_9SPHN|nr:hypothetical protein [Tsuneonella deserti]GGE01597.1 hypothetical protein GCM10011515_21650 [Tsuneonella deserti]
MGAESSQARPVIASAASAHPAGEWQIPGGDFALLALVVAALAIFLCTES